MTPHATITEEALAQLRQRLGVPVHRRHPHIQLAGQDAIRHFARGVGDPRSLPLWHLLGSSLLQVHRLCRLLMSPVRVCIVVL
jgi:hypothetical protein